MSTTLEEKKASAQRSRDMKDDGRDQRLMSKSGVMEKKDQDAYAKIAIHACDSFWKKFNDCAKGKSISIPFLCSQEFNDANACTKAYSAAHPYEEYRDARNAERAKEALASANQ